MSTTATKEAMAAAYVAMMDKASLHTADPGTTGANKVSGGNPAYADLAVTWTAGAVDGMYTSNALLFNVPANTTVTHVGLWQGNTFRDSRIATYDTDTQGQFRVTLTYTQKDTADG